MVLCHQAGRERVRPPAAAPPPGSVSTPAIPPLGELIESYERAAGWVCPSRVVAVALNTLGLPDAEARSAVERAARETGLAAADPVRFGAAPLVEAVEACRGRARATLG
jgi:uncharacterized NAD-dependent epimerase/dehydratase family protein